MSVETMPYESILNRTDWPGSQQVRKKSRRLISFRIAEDEYAALMRVCEANGARSISDFARYAVLTGIESSPTLTGSLQCDITTLAMHLRKIDAQLRATRTLIARILGEKSADADDASEEGNTR